MDFLPAYEFQKCVSRYRGDHKVQNFSCRDQFLSMAFAQLTYRESLRDIETCLQSIGSKLYHMGFRSKVARSTLADANESRDWRIYADFAQVLIAIARPLYASDPIDVDLDQSLYALDSTTIDLCLSLFPWAKFREHKAAVKMHTLLDLHGNIPTFIRITGPISSFFLSAVFYFVGHYSGNLEMVGATSRWLAEINFMLAAFNLAPGFPLDGGRVLRSIAWRITGDFSKAARIASQTGQVFAYVMIFAGIWIALQGNWFGGLWWVFIGWFLLSAAQESYAQVAIRNTLAGVSAADIMSQDVPTMPRDFSLENYVHEVLRTGRRCHIVTDLTFLARSRKPRLRNPLR
jgi:Zn-dependent protease